MIAEAFLKKRQQKGREEGIEKQHAAWLAWHKRWQAAQQRGEPFDEPPPEKQKP